MPYFKNLKADSILKVSEDQVETYKNYPDTYAECDKDGKVKAEAKTEPKTPKAPKAPAKEAVEEPKEEVKAEAKTEPKAGVEER